MAIILVPSLLRNVTTQSKTFHKKPYLSQTKLKPHPSSLESQETISARRCEHAASLLASCLDIGGIFFCFGGGGGGGGGGPPGPTPKFPIDATSGFRADLSLYIYIDYLSLWEIMGVATLVLRYFFPINTVPKFLPGYIKSLVPSALISPAASKPRVTFSDSSVSHSIGSQILISS